LEQSAVNTLLTEMLAKYLGLKQMTDGTGACILILPVHHSNKEHVKLFQMPIYTYYTEDYLPAPV
jgi:hypothetical protein